MSAVEPLNGKKSERRRMRTSDTSDTSIGQLLLHSGKLSESDVNRVMLTQRQQELRFGAAAVSLGLVTEEDIQGALERQFDYPHPKLGESALSVELVAAYQPFSPQAEALRALRTQLMLRWFRNSRKALAIVAPRSEQGCSTVAANLAVVFAQLGERTLLIDANCRKPRQHELFGLKPQLGLSNILAGRGAFKDAPLSVPAFENLFVLCAGSAAPNPQELLGRVGFTYILETAPAAYDVVIIDTPPVLEYADAQMIAAQAGACAIVTRRHKSRVRDVQRAKTQLVPTGAIILGSVICD